MLTSAHQPLTSRRRVVIMLVLMLAVVAARPSPLRRASAARARRGCWPTAQACARGLPQPAHRSDKPRNCWRRAEGARRVAGQAVEVAHRSRRRMRPRRHPRLPPRRERRPAKPLVLAAVARHLRNSAPPRRRRTDTTPRGARRLVAAVFFGVGQSAAATAAPVATPSGPESSSSVAPSTMTSISPPVARSSVKTESS